MIRLIHRLLPQFYNYLLYAHQSMRATLKERFIFFSQSGRSKIHRIAIACVALEQGNCIMISSIGWMWLHEAHTGLTYEFLYWKLIWEVCGILKLLMKVLVILFWAYGKFWCWLIIRLLVQHFPLFRCGIRGIIMLMCSRSDWEEGAYRREM